MTFAYLRHNCQQIRRVLVCLTAFVATGCGSHHFVGDFPADDRLLCITDDHIIRAVQFTFNPGADQNRRNRADSGQVVVTFGDSISSFDVSGAFTFTDMKHTTSPTGIITVTFAPNEEDLRQYRELVVRVRAAQRPGQDALIPGELPARIRFTGQFTNNSSSPLILSSEPFGRGEFPRR